MRQRLIGLLAGVMLLMSGAVMAAQVEVSGDMSIIGVAGQDGLIFPDLSKQTRAVNATDWQMRVVGFCQPGSAISEILSGGAVSCQAAGTGTVTSIETGTGLIGGPVTTTGTISLANTTVTPGSYTRANISVDQQGRLTSAGNGGAVNLATEVTGILPVANGGTGTDTPNFVDLANPQTVEGAKTFSSDLTLSGNLNLPATGIIKAGANRLITFGTFGESNFFAGSNAGNQTMTAAGNTAIGYNALFSSVTGSYNTASGMYALNSNTEGGYNTASGHMALYNNTTGSNNIAIGHQALYGNTLGTENTAVGNNALFLNDTGNSNTASGYHALYFNNTGSFNTAGGRKALYSNSTGSQNIAIGNNALYSNTTAGKNTAVGGSALFTQSYANGGTAWGSDNTAVGFEALYSNQPTVKFNGNNNTALGSHALRSNITGFDNTAVGTEALFFNENGYANTAVGNTALLSNRFGSMNTAVGYQADAIDGLINATAIGFNAIVDASNKVRIGDTAVTLVETAGNLRVGAGSTAGCVQDGDGTVIAGICTSDARLKTDFRPFDVLLDRLVQLQPVYFRWKQGEYPELQLGSAESFGLIAQEVEKVLPELVTEDSRNGYKAVKYNMLPLMLLKAIKEQQEEIEALKAEHNGIEALKSELAEIKALLSGRN